MPRAIIKEDKKIVMEGFSPKNMYPCIAEKKMHKIPINERNVALCFFKRIPYKLQHIILEISVNTINKTRFKTNWSRGIY